MKISDKTRKKVKENVIQQLLDKSKIKVEIVTTYKISEYEKELILKKFNLPKEFEFINTIDTKIIGGFILKIDNTVYDMSLNGSITHYIDKIYEHS